MNEFIQQVTAQLGVSEDTARNATGGLLNMLKSQTGGADFKQMVEKLPGAREMMQEGPAAAPTESAGMLGGLMGKATSMMGGGAGSLAGLAGIAKQSGMEMDQLGKLGSMLLGFVKQKAGADVVGRVMEQVPDLKKLIG